MTLGVEVAKTPAQPSDDSTVVKTGQDPFLGSLALSTETLVRNHWGSILELGGLARADGQSRWGQHTAGG